MAHPGQKQRPSHSILVPQNDPVLLALVKDSKKYYTAESNSSVQSWDGILEITGMFAEI